jgi:hypothetical protein
MIPAVLGSGLALAADEVKQASFMLDNVTIHLITPFLPDQSISVAEPGDYDQAARSDSANPYAAFSITAAPFGFAPTGEAAPEAQHGGATEYKAELIDSRVKKGEQVLTDLNGPVATIFGQQITGQVSLVETSVLRGTPTPLVVVEWVVEAGPRLWIVRVEKELSAGTQDLNSSLAFLQSLGQIVVSSDNLAIPTTLVHDCGPACTPGPAGSAPSSVAPGMPRTGAGTMTEGPLFDNVSLLSAIAILVGFSALLGGITLRYSLSRRRGLYSS